MNDKTQITANYLIHMLKSVINHTQPDELPEGITFNNLYQLAKFHSVQCTVFYAIEKLKILPEEEFYKKWRSERDQHIVRSMEQLYQRDMIIDQLTDQGIDILPLKGCLLKEMYPQIDYRQMADLDILIDKKKASLAKDIMESLGYSTTLFGQSNHDVYSKPPYMGVELHTDMMSEAYENYHYYQDVWGKAIPNQDNKHCFHFSWDDYYIFMIAHFGKHYFSGGSGIRSIMDIYVFLNTHKDDLHQDYLKQELEKMKLWEFKETAEYLSTCWFANGQHNKDSLEMAQYVISSGVYGTIKNAFENKINEWDNESNSLIKGRVSNVFKNIFPSLDHMQILYPFLKKWPILLPVGYIMRILRVIFRYPQSLKYYLKAIFKPKKAK